MKRLGHHCARERTMATGDKQMRARPGDALALGEILLEGRSRRGMQREQPTFLAQSALRADSSPFTAGSGATPWRA